MITRIVREAYFHMIDGKDWPHLYKLFTLTQTNASTPTHMTVPDNVMDYQYVRYNEVKGGRNWYREVCYKTPEDFITLISPRNNTKTDIDSVTDTSGILLNIRNNRHPTYYTSFDDKSIVMDSYDKAVDTTGLQTSKTQCRGKIHPVVEETDNFVFDLPADSFSYFLYEAKAMAFAILRKEDNRKTEEVAAIQRWRMSVQAHKNSINMNITYPNYGRRGLK